MGQYVRPMIVSTLTFFQFYKRSSCLDKKTLEELTVMSFNSIRDLLLIFSAVSRKSLLDFQFYKRSSEIYDAVDRATEVSSLSIL